MARGPGGRVAAGVEDAFSRWLEESRRWPLRSSSFARDYVALGPYREMVGMGRGALPLIAGKMREGHFMMARAMAEITGVDVRPMVKDHGPLVSDQKIADILLRWWDANSAAIMSGELPPGGRAARGAH